MQRRQGSVCVFWTFLDIFLLHSPSSVCVCVCVCVCVSIEWEGCKEGGRGVEGQRSTHSQCNTSFKRQVFSP